MNASYLSPLLLLVALPVACSGGESEPEAAGDGDGTGAATPVAIDQDGDGITDGYDTDGDGVIDQESGDTTPGGTGGSTSTGGAAASGGTTAGGGTTNTGGTSAGSPGICPAGSNSLTLNLAGATLTPLANITNNFPSGGSNIEGPVWLDGALYYSNIGGGQLPGSVIWKLVPGGTPEIVVANAGSNGLATDGSRLYTAMHSDGTISTRELSSLNTATPVATTYDSSRFNSPNDLVVASDGTVFFTDPNWQASNPNPQAAERTYRVSGGVATALATDNAPMKPNGITLSLDETILWIGGTNGLWRYPLNSDGSVGTGTQITTTSIPASDAGIDGLTRDCAGNIYVTRHSAKLVVILDAAGTQIGDLSVPSTSGVTNLAFGGANRQTLYVTSIGPNPQIHSVELNIPGYPY